MTERKFDACELSLEYKIVHRGNCGLMFHATENEGMPRQTGPEMQLLDNKGSHDPQRASEPSPNS